MVVEGKKDYVMKEKLKLLKDRLKWWNKEVYGWVAIQLEESVKEFNKVEAIVDDKENEGNLKWIEKRKSLNLYFWNNLQRKENLIRKKSRQKWIKEGDMNSRCFHNIMKSNFRRMTILSIETSYGRVEEVDKIKDGFKNHFESRFREDLKSSPEIEGFDFKSLHEEDIMSL